jgi:hypothetical protein
LRETKLVFSGQEPRTEIQDPRSKNQRKRANKREKEQKEKKKKIKIQSPHFD